jgi:hypothetical protein
LCAKIEPGHDLKAKPVRGGDHRPNGEGLAGPVLETGAGEAGHRIEAAHLHRGDKRHLVLRVPPNLAAGAFTAQVGIVDASVASERTLGFALTHGFHQLVVLQPGGFPRHTELAPQGRCSDLGLGLGHQLDGQEPRRQRQVCVQSNHRDKNGRVDAYIECNDMTHLAAECRQYSSLRPAMADRRPIESDQPLAIGRPREVNLIGT